ncbi:MAG: DUF1156 domain-containing protein [Acidobacteriota bacterium]
MEGAPQRSDRAAGEARCRVSGDRKKLIEVALPLEAINKASAREKSIRHGHPSTLHLRWAPAKAKDPDPSRRRRSGNRRSEDHDQPPTPHMLMSPPFLP